MRFLHDEHGRQFIIVNCAGEPGAGHDDGFGVNFRVYTDDDTPATCPDCGRGQDTGQLRVMQTMA